MMAVNQLTTEQLLKFSEIAKLLPRNRRRKKVHPSTLHRWRQGYRGVRLEALLTPSGWVTSLAAVHRFFEQLGVAGQTHTESPPAPEQADADQVERRLAEWGL
jgi:hypothetical protein